MVHLAFRYVAVVATSLLIFAVAQAENRADKHAHEKKAQQDEKLAIQKAQERMNKSIQRGKFDPKSVKKSALKK